MKLQRLSERKQHYLELWGDKIPAAAQSESRLIPRAPDALWSGLFYVIPQLAMRTGTPVRLTPEADAIWDASLPFLAERMDCSDFIANAALRILFLSAEGDTLEPARRESLKSALRHFVYWRDEREFHPGHQLTENHQIMFHAAELLAGELLSDEIFPSADCLGIEHARRGKERVLRWIDWRMRFGFSEWLSQHYFEEDFVPLINLYQFAVDSEVRERARVLLDLMMFEMATNSFRGVYTATQGRTYIQGLLDPDSSVTAPVRWMLWGVGDIDRVLSMGGICLATSTYEPPEVIQKIAFDPAPEMENRQRCSLNYTEALDAGIDPAQPENHGLFVSLGYQYWQDYMRHSIHFLNPDRWEGKDAKLYLSNPSLQPCGKVLPENPFVYGRVHPYAFRTPDFLLSCANDWNKGHRGYQHHIWHATLPGKASVFTTCPNDIPRTGRWAGNAYVPRAVAYRNVLLCIYQPPIASKRSDELGEGIESHAWFPTFLFDEVIEENGWILGRKEGGFVGLRSLEPGRWVEPEASLLEVAGYGRFAGQRYDFTSAAANVWVCELGNASLHGSFHKFVASVSQARFAGDTSSIIYDSPSLGRIEFGWDVPFLVNGKEFDPAFEKRFSNPYCQAEFNSGQYVIRHEGQELVLQ